MSKYIPATAVARETYMQSQRKEFGLTTGDYLKYPSAEAKDYFVVKKSHLYADDGTLHVSGAEKVQKMDAYLVKVAAYRAEQDAVKTAKEATKVAKNVAGGGENEKN